MCFYRSYYATLVVDKCVEQDRLLQVQWGQLLNCVTGALENAVDNYKTKYAILSITISHEKIDRLQ